MSSQSNVVHPWIVFKHYRKQGFGIRVRSPDAGAGVAIGADGSLGKGEGGGGADPQGRAASMVVVGPPSYGVIKVRGQI